MIYCFASGQRCMYVTCYPNVRISDTLSFRLFKNVWFKQVSIKSIKLDTGNIWAFLCKGNDKNEIVLYILNEET